MRFSDIRNAIAKGQDIPVTPVTRFTTIPKGKPDRQLQNRSDRRKNAKRK